MRTLYRVLSLEDLAALERDGVFRGSLDDLRDGFIHLSRAHQVSGTLEKHYAERADLVLLSVSADGLLHSREQRLEWETSRGGDRFPHLYGTLPVSAVVKVVPLTLDAAGQHRVPELED
jgi:uncharacterized protein (DUF952 family)